MHFQVSTQEFSEALSDVVLPGSKTGLEGISLILVEVTPSEVTVTGSDLDMVVARKVSASAQGEFSFTTGARRVLSVFRALPGETAQAKLGGGGKFSIVSGVAKAVIPTGMAEEFPDSNIPAGQTRFEMGGGDLRRHLERVHYAAAKDGSRYICMGVSLDIESGRIRFAATDAKRVSLSVEEGSGRGKAQCVIPTKAVERLMKILPRDKGRVEIGISAGWATFTWGGGSLSTKLLEGTFPNFSKLLDDTATRSSAVARRGALLDAVRRAAAAGGGEGIITLSIRSANEEDIGLLGSAPGVVAVSLPEGVEGAYSEILPLEFAPSRDSKISLFSDYLSEPLAVGGGDTVTLKYGEPTETVVLDQPGEIMSILSPVRLK
jgi:DNA polymerase-3 subunit beta